jgi:hypothetical protein
MTVLDRKLITRMVNPQPGGNGGGAGGAGGAGVYELPAASNSELGGIKLGYPTGTGKFYPVQLDSQQRAYVDVPWTDHYAWDDITSKPATATRWPSWDEVTSKPATATRWPSWTEVTSKPTSKTAWGKTYLNSSSEFQSISGDLSAGSSGGTISQFHSIELNSAGSLSGYGGFIDFHFNGSSSDYTSRIIEDASGEINIMATTKVNRLYSRGGSTALSDARKKNVLGDVELSVDDIARMPAVRFRWKDPDQAGTFIGTLAQSWREILPEAVQPIGDTLGFDYNGAAIVAVVNLAKAVQKIIAKMDRYGFK